MDNKTYEIFQEAKKRQDLYQMKKLYENNPNDKIICFEYAKLLSKKKKNNEARPIFLSLLNSQNRTYAMLELGKLEKSEGNIGEARNYFESLLNAQNRTYAMLELGRLEYIEGNIEKSRNYFESLLNTQNRTYAIVNLMVMYIKEQNYIDAFKYLKYSKDSKIKTSFKTELFIMKELNIFFDEENKIPISYNNLQIVDYDEFVALEHVIENHDSDFSKDIDIYRLFNDIKSKLTEEYKKRKLVLNDIYEIPYENVGENCHILRVVTLPNSHDILSMYPLLNDYLELDEETEEELKLKSRVRTR